MLFSFYHDIYIFGLCISDILSEVISCIHIAFSFSSVDNLFHLASCLILWLQNNSLFKFAEDLNIIHVFAGYNIIH